METSSSKFRLLVVDDDALVRDSLPLIIPSSWTIFPRASQKEVHFGADYDAALVDMHLTNDQGAEGLKVIEKLHKNYPHLEIIAMSGDLNRELMEKTLKAGASRFLAKPLSPEEVQLTLNKVESLLLLQRASLRSKLSHLTWIGSGKESSIVKKSVAELMGEAGPILIEGETGTGKEVIASLLQQQAPNQPFIAFNVAAIPENLFESEFFGHVKGAFTGADQNKMGLAEAADRGALFIDEIEALPLKMQVKLLRFLESGEVKRVGSKQTIKVKCRVILATNKNLHAMVDGGEFREDLLWRINGSKILLPPLRDRSEDVKELCSHFFSQDPYRKKSLSDEALELLTNYSWPGNVRELKRCCEQLLIHSPLPIIRLEDVEKIVSPRVLTSISNEKIDLNTGLAALLQNFEAHVIAKSLDQYKDIDEAAKTLKISRSNLYKKIKDFGIDWRN